MKLPTKTMTSEHLPGASFTVEVAHHPDDPRGPLVFEAIVSDGIVSSEPDRRDLATHAATRDFVAQAGLDTFPPARPLSGGPTLDAAASLQQLVDAFRRSAVDQFAWKQAAKLIAPQIDLSQKHGVRPSPGCEVHR